MQPIFPTEKYQVYLKKCECEKEENFTDVKVEELVKIAFKEFKNNELSLGSFCLLGEYLFYKIKEQSNKFASVLLDCSEINYYLQIQDNDSDEFNTVMERIEKYFSI